MRGVYYFYQDMTLRGLIRLALCVLLTGVLLCGCETIPEGERLIPMSKVGGARVHVLVEYTGFRCVNCPTAAGVAEELRQVYGKQLVVVSMHPGSNPFTHGKYDYTCEEADECYRWMGGTATTPLPTGNLDFGASGSGYFIDYHEWASLLAGAETSVVPHLEAYASADTISGEVRLHVEASAAVETAARMAVWLTEDSVRGVQAMTDGGVDTAYYHRHLLREALDHEPFGKEVVIGRQASTFQYRFELAAGYRPRQCRLIVLLMDKEDRHIIQAYETEMDFSIVDAVE